MVNMVWCENRVSKLNIFQQSHFDGQFFALKYETNTMKAMCEEIRPGTRGSRQIKLGSMLKTLSPICKEEIAGICGTASSGSETSPEDG